MQRELFLITVICSIIIFPFTVFSEPISEEILNFKIKGNDQSKEDPNEQGDSSRVDTKNLKPFDYLMIEKQGLSDNQNNSGLIDYLSNDMLDGLSVLPIAKDNFGFIRVLYHEGDYYATASCHFDVFKWVKSKWQNLYTSDNKGFNCGTRFFFYQGKLHSLGGYGLWRPHSDLLVFDEVTGSWNKIYGSGQPTDLHSDFVSVAEDRIYSFFPKDSFASQNDTAYTLDLKTFVWSRYDVSEFMSSTKSEAQFFIYGSESELKYFDLKDYTVFFVIRALTGDSGMVVFDKNSFSFHWLANQSLETSLRWRLFLNNQVLIKNKREEYIRFDFDQLIKDAVLLGEPKEILLAGEKDLVRSIWRWSILAFLLGLSINRVFVLFRYKRDFLSLTKEIKENIASNKNDQALENQVNELLSRQGQLLTKDQLDKILQLPDNKNSDSFKVLRSRTVISINKVSIGRYGVELVLREKDINDKRVILYRINNIL